MSNSELSWKFGQSGFESLVERLPQVYLPVKRPFQRVLIPEILLVVSHRQTSGLHFHSRRNKNLIQKRLTCFSFFELVP